MLSMASRIHCYPTQYRDLRVPSWAHKPIQDELYHFHTTITSVQKSSRSEFNDTLAIRQQYKRDRNTSEYYFETRGRVTSPCWKDLSIPPFSRMFNLACGRVDSSCEQLQTRCGCPWRLRAELTRLGIQWILNSALADSIDLER